MDKDEYLVISRATNGYMVSINSDEMLEDDREVCVFNTIEDTLEHVGSIMTMPPAENVQ